MSDLFHKQVPRAFVEQVCETMERASWHTFQVLTKRSSLMRDFLKRRYGASQAPMNVWFGVSIEDRSRLSRLMHLQETPARTRFLSLEPLLGSLGALDLTGISWVIVGGESGPRARPIRVEWVREIRDQCVASGVPFFFKQWGGMRPKSKGRQLDGREWSEFPSVDGQMAIAAE